MPRQIVRLLAHQMLPFRAGRNSCISFDVAFFLALLIDCDGAGFFGAVRPRIRSAPLALGWPCQLKTLRAVILPPCVLRGLRGRRRVDDLCEPSYSHQASCA